MRWLSSLADLALDFLLWSAPRKGSLIPRDDDLEPVRRQVRACTCADCRCRFNKDLTPLDGRGQE